MSDISAAMVKDLREKTGAGMMDCKKALVEAAGDFAKASEWLRKKGITKAAAKGDRIAAEGLVGLEVADGGKLVTAVEVNSETDFVARNEEFVALVGEMVRSVAEHAPTTVAELLETSDASGKKRKDLLIEKVAAIGENITVRRFARIAAGPNAVVGGYLHSNGKLAALVEIAGSTTPDAAELARELAMQVAAMKPAFIERDGIPARTLAKEKEIISADLLRTKKPEAVWERITIGKIEKFYEDNVLVDQKWIKDDSKRVKDLLSELGKKLGSPLRVGQVARIEVGEGIEKPKEDLRAEVEKTLKS